MKLSDLRVANVYRNNEYPGSSKIDLGFRCVEHAGEVGELLNKIKKYIKQQRGIAGSRTTMEELEEEFADVLITLDLLAMWFDIDLAEVTIAKFNKTSEELGLQTKLK